VRRGQRSDVRLAAYIRAWSEKPRVVALQRKLSDVIEADDAKQEDRADTRYCDGTWHDGCRYSPGARGGPPEHMKAQPIAGGRVVIASLQRRAKALRLLVFIAGLALIAYVLHFLGLGMNLTDSMPVGIYHLVAADRAPVKGDIVKLCPPAAVAAEANERAYLPHGPCPGNTIPLLKIVAAVPGDVVDVSRARVAINGYALPGSAQQERDKAGRELGRYPAGRYRLAGGVIWLWTPNPRSWDSRYFGPVPAASVSGFARLVLAFWDWPYAHTR
jgi:conjugative transfer signal peptidase TraF